MAKLRSHGVTKVQDELNHQDQGDWYYEQQSLGFNYRMTELQAALGLSQLKRLDDFLEKRQILASRYHELLKDLPIELPVIDECCRSSWHLFVIRLNNPESRKSVFEGLKKAGIGVQVHYIPIHTQPYYQNLGFHWGQFPRAEAYYHAAISLPIFPDLTFEQQDFVIETLSRLLKVKPI